MADGSNPTWRPQGSGPHSTLAGNIYDPNVQADGRMAAGPGVGGTAPSHIKEEGAEHIKKNPVEGANQPAYATGISETGMAGVGNEAPTGVSETGMAGIGSTGSTGYGTTGSTGLSSSDADRVHQDGTDHIKDKLADREMSSGTTGLSSGTTGLPSGSAQPASNPGYGDPSAGISSGAGGTSTTAPLGTEALRSNDSTMAGSTTAPTTSSDNTYLGTVKNMLGLGGSSNTSHTDPSTTGSSSYPTSSENQSVGQAYKEDGVLAAGGAAAAGAGAYAYGNRENDKPSALGSSSTGTTGAVDDNTTDPYTQGVPTTGATGSADKSEAAMPTTGTIGEGNDTTTNPGDTFDGNTDRSGPTADPTNDGSTSHEMTENERSSENNESSKNKKAPGGGGSHQENRDAIPTAGGEKLGQKHWGESKVVPDNPKKAAEQEQAKGVSSKDGQPTSEVQDNTSKNTGGATSGPQSSSSDAHGSSDSAGKESFVDKMKDKLHIGKK